MADTEEILRIRKAYQARDAAGKGKLYSYFDPAFLYFIQQREKALIFALKRAGMTDLSGTRILDVGCGYGQVLRELVKYGARPGNCFGIDLLPDRIEQARHISPNFDLRCGSAESLPYDDASFDMVLLFTVFTSILDGRMKQALAGEVLRVLRPNGKIFWYDYHMDNPKNPDVKGVDMAEIRSLFKGCTFDLRKTTLAPPITRLVIPYTAAMCYMLEKLSLFNTHYAGIITKGAQKS